MSKEKRNFLEEIIDSDLINGLDKNKIKFRFPPEPNGYLHIGHAKSICLNFGLGKKYNSPVNLRFDDTNPEAEEKEYVDSIKNDIAWLGFSWDKECYASDYFDQLYKWALDLIKMNKAYVDEQSQDDILEQKGTTTKPGINSPFRERSIEENLDLFDKMMKGYYNEGECVLRAKINMASVNMHMRDPIIYRILKKPHHRTGKKWIIYPMYDWTHGQSDYIEKISHSLCTLEFEVHRELYDWFLDQIAETKLLRPKQREFARLNMSYTIMSKRKLSELVSKQYVTGWDDPRLPTISGLRRRGYPPKSIRDFCKKIGVAKRNNIIDISLLEYCAREDLNNISYRVMGVLNPIKLIIDNYSDLKEENLTAENNPENKDYGSRLIPFCKELYIEKEDFKEDYDKNFYRLSIGKEVRLKNAYIIKGKSVEKDSNGNVQTIHCTFDSKSKSGSGTDESRRKIKGTIHWVSARHAVKCKVMLYDRLFNKVSPDENEDIDFKNFLNPNSLKEIKNVFIEPCLRKAKKSNYYQFQRLGYFKLDKNSTENDLIFNKTVSLRDTWSKNQI